MSSSQFKILASLGAVVIGLLLAIILPPTGWAVIAVIAASYAACWVVERAIRRVWRR